MLKISCGIIFLSIWSESRADRLAPLHGWSTRSEIKFVHCKAMGKWLKMNTVKDSVLSYRQCDLSVRQNREARGKPFAWPCHSRGSGPPLVARSGRHFCVPARWRSCWRRRRSLCVSPVPVHFVRSRTSCTRIAECNSQVACLRNSATQSTDSPDDLCGHLRSRRECPGRQSIPILVNESLAIKINTKQIFWQI